MNILAVGAHPDDIEFGCGGILLREAAGGARISLRICSKGEAGSHGDGATREAESRRAAEMLDADLSFLDLGGDALIECSKANVLALAREIRRLKPRIVLAPSLVEDQHPDHAAVGAIVREAARLARYAGLEALNTDASWAIQSLYYYAITPGGEPKEGRPVLVDIGNRFEAWVAMMECHGSQLQTRNYVDLQVARARSLGLQSGREYAQALWSNDAWIVDHLSDLPTSARSF